MDSEGLGAADGRVFLGAQSVEPHLKGADLVAFLDYRLQGGVGYLDAKMGLEVCLELGMLAREVPELQVVALALGEADQVGIGRIELGGPALLELAHMVAGVGAHQAVDKVEAALCGGVVEMLGEAAVHAGETGRGGLGAAGPDGAQAVIVRGSGAVTRQNRPSVRFGPQQDRPVRLHGPGRGRRTALRGRSAPLVPYLRSERSRRASPIWRALDRRSAK